MTEETDEAIAKSLPRGIEWPRSEGEADAATRDYSIAFLPTLGTDRPVVTFVRRIRTGDQIAETVLWQKEFATLLDARRSFEWLNERSSDWTLWGRHSEQFGPDAILSALGTSMAADRASRAARLVEDRRKARKKREKAKMICSYLVERDERYGLDLRRGDSKRGFFEILFRERWERERFRDWFRCQSHRFTEFAVIFEEKGPLELERALLREMLATERRVKAAGESAGGRRPLRFYRGDEE